MKRIVFVYNPRSSQHELVETEVLMKLRAVKGITLARYEIQQTDVDDNAKKLARLLMENDLVLAAGGDGTATIAANAAMLSVAPGIKYAVLGYGNYNDTARSFGGLSVEDILSTKPREIWPLDVKVNNRHWRYAMCYFTAGMFAESCAVYDTPKVRKALQKKGRRGFLFNVSTLAKWWLKERKHTFLPEFTLGDSSGEAIMTNGASDYMAINSLSVAKMMKGGKWYEQNSNFLSYFGKMTTLGKILSFMRKSIFKQIPGMESDYDRLDFVEPATIMVQAEGEYSRLEDVQKIEIKKSSRPLLVIMKNE